MLDRGEWSKSLCCLDIFVAKGGAISRYYTADNTDIVCILRYSFFVKRTKGRTREYDADSILAAVINLLVCHRRLSCTISFSSPCSLCSYLLSFPLLTRVIVLARALARSRRLQKHCIYIAAQFFSSVISSGNLWRNE